MVEVTLVCEADMKLPPVPRMSRAIDSGDVAEVRRVLEEHPDQLSYLGGGGGSWLHKAASKGQNAIIDVLIEAGMDVNIDSQGSTEPLPPLDHAIPRGQIETVRHLIEMGADVNLGRSLFAAIGSKSNSRELVKMLIDYGADINRCWYMGDPKSGVVMNPLSFAIAYGKTEIADYLRTLGGMFMPTTEPKRPPEGMEQEVIAYFDANFGPVLPQSIVEIIPTGPPIAVHVIRLQGTQSHHTFHDGYVASSQ